MQSGNVSNLQDFEYNEIKFKQRSFEDCTGTLFHLFSTDLLLVLMPFSVACLAWSSPLCQ